MPPSGRRSLEQVLEAFVEDLEVLDGALLKFEEALLELEDEILKEGVPEQMGGQNPRLLSPLEVCQELGEGRAVVYQKLRGGEIPALKLGHALKVRREDLEEYMNPQQHPHLLGEENGFTDMRPTCDGARRPQRAGG
jgi:excisionase family DNA binding protein